MCFIIIVSVLLKLVRLTKPLIVLLTPVNLLIRLAFSTGVLVIESKIKIYCALLVNDKNSIIMNINLMFLMTQLLNVKLYFLIHDVVIYNIQLMILTVHFYSDMESDNLFH